MDTHSITSSARASRVGGASIPNAFAVLRIAKTYSRDAEAFVGHAGAGLL
jgi:hypothetical protein